MQYAGIFRWIFEVRKTLLPSIYQIPLSLNTIKSARAPGRLVLLSELALFMAIFGKKLFAFLYFLVWLLGWAVLSYSVSGAALGHKPVGQTGTKIHIGVNIVFLRILLHRFLVHQRVFQPNLNKKYLGMSINMPRLNAVIRSIGLESNWNTSNRFLSCVNTANCKVIDAA